MLLGLLCFVGCERRGERPTVVACVPGAVVTCPCSGGSSGSQTCQGSGTFGPCACLVAAPAVHGEVDKPPPVVPSPEAPVVAATPTLTQRPVPGRPRANEPTLDDLGLGGPADPPRPPQPTTPAAVPWVPTMMHCADSTDCAECAHRSGCGWCGASNICLPTVNCSGPINGSCSGGWACTPGSCPSREVAPPPEVVNDPCARLTDCASCTQATDCGWCQGRHGSVERAPGCMSAGSSCNPSARPGRCSGMWLCAAQCQVL